MAKLISNDRPLEPRIQAALYGLGGSRKTFTSMHLPLTGKTWEHEGKPGKIIYIAADKTSPKLDSISIEDRKRVLMYVPNGNQTVDKDGNLKTDWKVEMARLCQTTWIDKHPEAIAIVYDTVTASSVKLLHENAKMAYFSDKGARSGPSALDHRISQEKESMFKVGQEGDYNMVQQTTIQNLDWLITLNESSLHIICLFHECLSKQKDGLPQVYGPASVGQMGPRQIPQLFGTNLWLEVESGELDPKQKGSTRVSMIDSQKHISNVKCSDPSLVPEHKFIGKNPQECRDMWTWIQGIKSK